MYIIIKKTTNTCVFLKIKFLHILVFSLVVLTFSACSLKKNTWSTRAYQSMNTRFNVYFNGKESYEEGLRNIYNSNKEDYSAIIPMYPISRHDNANSAKSNMDRTIEKCRKAIKLHSIKQKPLRNDRKWSNPEYQLWYKQEEFNPALKDAWMLLAQAEFHKADFIGSVGTFTYISRHFANDKDMVARCQLWIARAYGELGWIYEAEQMLSRLKQDDLKFNHIGLFAAVNADLLLKKHQYKEAIPFLELTLKTEKNKTQQQRFNFLLAQLYKKTGDNQSAYQSFTKVIKLNPPFEMDFNARIYRAELDNRNVESVRKELNKMLRNPNNKEYLDQIYYTLGKTYLQKNDTVKALEYFKTSIEKSIRNGFDKAVSLITLGDLYYKNKNYIKAQPCYDEASKIITTEQEDYARVSKLAETLSELVVQNEIVVLQDSLQFLSTLSDEKRLEVVNKIITQLIADEKVSAEAELAKNESGFNPEEENMTLIGENPGGVGSWYFYNSNLLKTGQSDFQKKWGKRKLEDNWRRANKSSVLFAEETSSDVLPQSVDNQNDSTAISAAAASDNKNPAFYLKQIPVTPQQIEKSNAEIATALFNMGMIYKDKVEDYAMAVKTFDEFAKRFPTDERRLETYFQSYMLESKTGNPSKADVYKNKLISEFPNSKYVEVISQPDYFDRMTRMYREQDLLYSITYNAYNASDYKTVKKNAEFVKKNYPLSVLLPKFMFLNALSVGKTEQPDVFEASLNDVVDKFPESDVSAMSKDILALIKQGREATAGTSHGTLLSRRERDTEQAESDIVTRQYSDDKATKHRLLLVTDADVQAMNKLLYNIAAYNFSCFMVKDFDLLTGKLDNVRNSLSVTNFESYQEVEWYVNSISKNAALSDLMNELKIEKVIISEENYGILRSLSSLEEYFAFQSKNLLAKAPALTTKNNVAENKKETPSKRSTAKTEPTAVLIEKQKQAENLLDKNALETVVLKQQHVDTTTEVPKTSVQPVAPVMVPPKEEAVPLFKNLFAYRANEPHYVSVAVLSGTFDYDKLKMAFDQYNSQNYSMLNLKLNKEDVAKMQVIIIGPFANADLAKSYLIRMVKERSLFDNLKGTDYRNLLGSQKNLNTMLQQNAMSTYFEFMQQYYLK